MTTETDPIVRTRETRRPSARLRFSVAFLIGLVLTFGLGVGAMYAYDQQYTGRVLPGVRVGNVDLSGLTPAAARSALDDAYQGMTAGRIVLAGPDGDAAITYAQIGRRLDTDGLVAEAMAVGRDGSAVDRAVANARTAFRGVDLQPRIAFDAQGLSDRIAAIAQGLRIDPIEAAVTSDDTLAFKVAAGHPGRTVDTTGVAEEIARQVGRLDAPTELSVTLRVQVQEPIVSTAEATAAQAAAERIAAGITLVVGETSVPIDTKKLRPLISFATSDGGDYAPVVDTTRTLTLLDGIAAKVDRKVLNASFKTSGTKVTGVIASRDGYALDVPATARQIEALLAARAIGTASTEIQPVLKITKPVLTTTEAEAAAPKMRRISSWTTFFQITEKNGFGANIWIPALTIDGYVVGPRETFDYWKAVGPITRAKGYRQGGAIINGKTEPQGALAGGICSNSTTLFNAVLRAGFEMGARRNHYYYIDRYPRGLDATVFISASGAVQTMSWTNDTDYPVLIRGYKIRDGNKGYVRFELYSIPNGRKVYGLGVGEDIVKNVKRATDTIQYTSSLAPGVRKRIEYPVDGMQVWRNIIVRDSKGTILHQTTYFSNYSRVTGLTLVGKGAATVQPQPPRPSPSPPPVQ